MIRAVVLVLGLCLGAAGCSHKSSSTQAPAPSQGPTGSGDPGAQGVWGELEEGTSFDDGELRHVFADGLVLLARVGEEREEGEALIAALAEARGDGLALEKAKRLPLGWTTLLVRADGSKAVRLLEPGYGRKEPGEALNPSIETSLAVLGDQRHVLELVQRPGIPVDWDEEIVVVGEALTAKRVYAVRVESPGSRLSGWRVAPDDDPNADADEDPATDPKVEYEQIHNLLVRRPALMQVLTLPPGYMVFFDGDQLVQIVDADNRVVWAQP